MKKLKVGILGAGGFGKFHAREFYRAGCDVVAILSRTKESSEKTSEKLLDLFGVSVRPYNDLEELLEKESLDAISICTPSELHEQHVRKCLEYTNVFCEKPFVLASQYENYKIAEELVGLAKEKKRVLTVNTQWPSIFPHIKRYLESHITKEFYMYMEPGKRGIGMLTENLPHTNSMLIRLVPNGKAENIIFLEKKEGDITIRFDYQTKRNCRVEYVFKFKQDRPRGIVFSINGKEFVRKIREDYQQTLVHEGNVIDIEDPLKISIRQFIDSIKRRINPLISEAEILENVYLQDLIIKEYCSKS